jgi:hypothetical protein
MNHGEIVSFLWGVADLIRDTFKRGKYQDVILPLTRAAPPRLRTRTEQREGPQTPGRTARQTGKCFLIFPRYQQLDAVRKLVASAREVGAGQRYLIQHSAGSGKSFTIAWLAHHLSTLHDASDQRVFDSIVVITDHRYARI